MFSELRDAVNARIQEMQSFGTLFLLDYDRKAIWDAYLNGFRTPELRQEHNCACCKAFIRDWGALVSISETGDMITLWCEIDIDEFNGPVESIISYLDTLEVRGPFYSKVHACGTFENRDTVRNVTWSHFRSEVGQPYVKDNAADLMRVGAENRAMLDLALEKFTPEAVKDVAGMIAENTLPRGRQFKNHVNGLRQLMTSLSGSNMKDGLLWRAALPGNEAVSRIRNSAIGVLIEDLSKGVDIEDSLKKYAKVVDPANYQQPTKAIANAAVIKKAQERVAELGMTGSINRTHATEVSISNLLYADRGMVLPADPFSEMAGDIPVDPEKLSPVSISMDELFKDKAKGADILELMVEGTNVNNFAALLGPSDYSAPSLFYWGNPYSLSYSGGAADSLKARIASHGVKVDGIVRASIEWWGDDDLDLHAAEPKGVEIFYGDSMSRNTGGHLNRDVNAGSIEPDPSENIDWPSAQRMLPGKYSVWVRNYTQRRNRIKQGFNLEFESEGKVYEFSEDRTPSNGGNSKVYSFEWHESKGLVVPGYDASKRPIRQQTKWGVKTNSFTRVRQAMLSPNYWGEGGRGNKHLFFTLDGCKADEELVPFFSEQLAGSLKEDRKVLHSVAKRVMVQPAETQMAGVAFSESNENSFILRVTKAGKQRVYRVQVAA